MKARRVIDVNRNRFMTTQDAADYFGVSRVTITEWAKQANALLKAGRVVRIDTDKVVEALECNKLIGTTKK